MRSTQRTIWLAAASVLISLVFTLGALEAALRIYYRVSRWQAIRALPQVATRAMVPSPDPELIFEWNPGWSGNGFTLNSLGMPNHEVALAKPAGTYRIAFVGDSLSANFGHRPRPEIYLNVLASRLDHATGRGVRFEALNFGVNAYGVLQSVHMLESRVLRFAPDLVIAQLCLNDPYPSSTEYGEFIPGGWSRLWDFVFRRLLPDRFWSWAYVEATYDETGVANVRRGIARLAELGRRGPPVLAVLFPYFYAPAYEQWDFERFHEIYRQAANEAGLPLLDLYAPLLRAGLIPALPFPADPIHPGSPVHERVAREIESRLDELQWLPQARARGIASAVAPDARPTLAPAANR